jgi:hypothetical protein
MKILKAENNSLTTGAKYSYLSTNYASGVSSFVLVNTSGIMTNDFILFSEFGQENAEILRVTGVTMSSNTITTTPVSRFAHSQDTKVTVLQYSQVRYYQTAAATFSASENPLTKSLGDSTTQFDITASGTTYRYTYDNTGTDPDIDACIYVNSQVVINAQNFTAANNGTFLVTGVSTNYFEVTNASGVAESNKTIGTGSIKYSINVAADSEHTTYQDTTNTTGYGWFCFYNPITLKITTNSNAIPYADFQSYSVKKIFDDFYSLLISKEQSLITINDAFRWLNEAYAIAQNHLNLVNQEYTVASPYAITTVSGTQEYSLPTTLGEIISVTNTYGDKLEHISLANVPKSDDEGGYSNTSVKYFLRGSYIGFSPKPTGADVYNLFHKCKSTVLTSYYDNISFPNNNYYILVDHMMYRAAIKLNRSNPLVFEKNFMEGINNMKLTAHKQNENKDGWSISSYANV